MKDVEIKVFDVNTDAISTNRGFYYQYLVVLKKWVLNFLSEKSDFIYSEVDDDIKEVGEKLVFTQVKCYSNNFSFKSTEIKKSIFNFFLLYLKNNQDSSTEFCFCTNTGIIKTEKLLKAWINDPKLVDGEVRKYCLLKVRSILMSEIKGRKLKKIENARLDVAKIDEIKLAAEELIKKASETNIGEFIKCIRWEFSDVDTDKAIDDIFNEVRQLLAHEKFKNKPISILEGVLLSEIYRCSQNVNKDERFLSNSTIKSILDKTDSDLDKYIHKEFLDLIGFEIEEIKQTVKKLQKRQELNELRLNTIDSQVEKLELGSSEISYPKELALVPMIFNENFFGRENCLIDVKNQLERTRVISISGCAGTGKTLLVQNFLRKYQSNYNHILWIKFSHSLVSSLVLNKELVNNLKLELNNEESLDSRFQIICNKLIKINGNNLLIIDDYEDDFKNLKSLISLNKWNVIITTREIVTNITKFELPRLDYESALSVYKNSLDRTVEDKKSALVEFFNFVDYNPLIIELFAKTISSSLDLDLNKVLSYLRTQNLDDDELNIDVWGFDENYPVKLLSYLQKKFELRKLSVNEEWCLEFLALLPSEDISIDDLANIGGEESYKKNKIHFTNLSNSLHRKGWVKRKGGNLKMHRLVQELIIYNSRNSISPFISCSFLITWLIHRIDENAQSVPSKSFKYLKYAESILFSIKEPYRTSLYQPLLLLENALLNAYNWINKSKNLHLRWQDLLKRAKMYLASDDANLGILYNNVGFSFVIQKDVTSSIDYFKKAVFTFEKNEKKAVNSLFNSLNNLIQNYFVVHEVENAQKSIKKVEKLINKYSIKDDQFNAVHYNVIGFGYQQVDNLEKAIIFYEKAIQAHLLININKRNDFYLSVYYGNLIGAQFLLQKHDKVIKNLIEVGRVLEDMKISENSFLIEIFEFLSSVTSFYVDTKQLEESVAIDSIS